MTIFTEKWKKEILKKPKLRTYCKIKENYSIERFVSLNLSSRERSILSQLHTGTLPLEIEIGRFRHISVENRKCKICKTEIEDELHLIFHCTGYKEERESFFRTVDVKQENSDIDKLKCLLKIHTRIFAKYVLKIMEIRNSKLLEE